MEFRQLSATLDYPLYVATTIVQGEPTGCLVGFATQCSIHPPRFLVCISRRNHTFRLAEQATMFAVHVIEERNRALAQHFGGETGDAVDKFKDLSWHPVDGVPVLDECARWFTGAVLGRIDLGDHAGHLLEPLTIRAGSKLPQMMFQQARSIAPGHRA